MVFRIYRGGIRLKRAANAIITCLKEKGITQTKLAERMGEDCRYLNQQLNRLQDMKVERFADVLDYMGYRLEIVENDGIQRVSQEFAITILESKEPKGLYWYSIGQIFVGIDNTDGEVWVEEFESKEECFVWLKRSKE